MVVSGCGFFLNGPFGTTLASKVENPIKFHPKNCCLAYLGQYSTRKKQKGLWDQDFHLIQSGGGHVLIPHIYGSISIFYYIVSTKTLNLPMRNGNFLSLTNFWPGGKNERLYGTGMSILFNLGEKSTTYLDTSRARAVSNFLWISYLSSFALLF